MKIDCMDSYHQMVQSSVINSQPAQLTLMEEGPTYETSESK
jgi:hypothetical protein